MQTYFLPVYTLGPNVCGKCPCLTYEMTDFEQTSPSCNRVFLTKDDKGNVLRHPSCPLKTVESIRESIKVHDEHTEYHSTLGLLRELKKELKQDYPLNFRYKYPAHTDDEHDEILYFLRCKGYSYSQLALAWDATLTSSNMRTIITNYLCRKDLPLPKKTSPKLTLQELLAEMKEIYDRKQQ